MMGVDRCLSEEEQRACEHELGRALADLREHLETPLRLEPGEEASDLRGKLLGIAAARDTPHMNVSWDEAVELPRGLEPLVEHFIDEATANALKHTRPTRLDIRVEGGDDGLIEVINDGVSPSLDRKPGIGQRLLAAEALMHGCEADFGPVGSQWRARLLLSPRPRRGDPATDSNAL
jgi:signal transduction histidine kinase